jgi:hypothetical protein
MSVAIMAAVFKVSLPPSEKVVALALADHAHDDGTEARPGKTSLADKCTLSVRQVQRVVKLLIEKRIIEVQREATNTTPVCYRFVLDDRGELIGGDNLSGGDTGGRLGVTSEVIRGDMGVTQTIKEPSLEPSSLLSKSQMANPSLNAGVVHPAFEQLWKVYPRKVKKADAYNRFKARLREGIKFEELLEATGNYRDAMVGVEEQFIMHPTTFWLHAWKDWTTDARHGTSANVSGDVVDEAIGEIERWFLSTPRGKPIPEFESKLLGVVVHQVGEFSLRLMSTEQIRYTMLGMVRDGALR